MWGPRDVAFSPNSHHSPKRGGGAWVFEGFGMCGITCPQRACRLSSDLKANGDMFTGMAHLGVRDHRTKHPPPRPAPQTIEPPPAPRRGCGGGRMGEAVGGWVVHIKFRVLKCVH